MSVQIASFKYKGTKFCCVIMRFVEEIVIIFAIFHIRYVLFSTSYFSSEKDRGVVKLLSHILKSLFHFVLKNCQNCKFR